MKYLALTLAFWAFPVHPADVCETVWVYKPWKSCSNPKNGLDPAKSVTLSEKVLPTPAVSGGSNSNRECGKLAKTLEMDLPEYAVRAEKLDASENSSKDVLGHVTYVYTCKFRMTKVPYKSRGPACGTEDKYSYQTQGTAVALDGVPHCLSCDELNKQDRIVECLLYDNANWNEISNAVPIRREDRVAVLKKVNEMIRFEKATSFMSVGDKSKILDFQQRLQDEIKDR